MKPETKRVMLAQPVEIQQEIIALIAEALSDEQFVDALYDIEGEVTKAGDKIIEFILQSQDADSIRDEIEAEFINEADRLHEAICEGRKQDAIDILNKILPDAGLRSAHDQINLFPNRVEF